MEAFGGDMPRPDLRYVDDYLCGGYGKFTDELMDTVIEATRLTGLLFDTTYTGKAMYGLKNEIRKGRFGPDDHIVFWHTGGGFGAIN